MTEIIFDFENVGGLRECYAIAVSAFRGTRTDLVTNLHQLNNIIRKDDVIAIPMYADDTFSFSEDDDEKDGNKIWIPHIEGIIPKAGLNQQTMERLSRGEWIVLSEDNNGIVRLSGTAEIPLRCKVGDSTGTAYVERNGSLFVFEAKEMQPSVLMETFDI